MIPLLTKVAAIFDENKFDLPKSAGADSGNTVRTVLTFVFQIAGVISVLMVTMGAFQYVISQGDAQKVAKAKNTIMYAVIGLVVAITGVGIVNYVIKKVTA